MSASWEVYAEDCVAGIPHRVSAGSVSVIVTSPPYNIGKEYGTYDDTREDTDYLKWMRSVSKVIAVALAGQGSSTSEASRRSRGGPSRCWSVFARTLPYRIRFSG
jgi:hypothetical protein